MFVCHNKCNRCLLFVVMTFIHLRIEYALALETNQALMKMNTEIHMTNDRHAHLALALSLAFGFVVAFFLGFVERTKQKKKSILLMFSSAKAGLYTVQACSGKHAHSLQTSNPHME